MLKNTLQSEWSVFLYIDSLIASYISFYLLFILYIWVNVNDVYVNIVWPHSDYSNYCFLNYSIIPAIQGVNWILYFNWICISELV